MPLATAFSLEEGQTFMKLRTHTGWVTSVHVFFELTQLLPTAGD